MMREKVRIFKLLRQMCDEGTRAPATARWSGYAKMGRFGRPGRAMPVHTGPWRTR